MKKKMVTFLCVLVIASMGIFAQGSEENNENANEVVGMVWYNFNDTFITNVRNTIRSSAEGGLLDIVDADSQGDIASQNNNVNAMFAKKVDYLVVNSINDNDDGRIINEAKKRDIPVIFVNCNSPTEEELASYDKVFHIASDAPQAGIAQGEMLSKYWNEVPTADRNDNGKLDYIMLIGMPELYDCKMRTIKPIERLNENGIETNCLQEMVCNFSRADAMDKVASFIAARGSEVDAILANNDDMALGAIEALKAAGYFDDGKFLPVVGVDANKNGVLAIEDGTLLGTAFFNPVELGQTVYKVLDLLRQGKEVTTESVGKTLTGGKHIYLDFITIQADNVEDANF